MLNVKAAAWTVKEEETISILLILSYRSLEYFWMSYTL